MSDVLPENELFNFKLHCAVDEWQQILNLLARILNVPAALIMHTDGKAIEVFVASESEGNPYEPAQYESLIGSGLYCERVIQTREPLYVANALKDPEWNQNPDLKLGMISYVGFPIKAPNGEVFGTICVLDTKESAHSSEYMELIERFKNVIELGLENIGC
jgi:GAF domain-containing protein